ncbi:hypothetical protein WJX74_003494 [Apatococcus lobatus]
MSPLQGAVVGICAMLTSAVAVGAAHFQFTGKQLVEEGIDPSTRRRALPIAGKALAVSSGICIAAGLAGVVIMQGLDIPRREFARVSVPEAYELVHDQQEAVRQGLHNSWKQRSASWR